MVILPNGVNKERANSSMTAHAFELMKQQGKIAFPADSAADPVVCCMAIYVADRLAGSLSLLASWLIPGRDTRSIYCISLRMRVHHRCRPTYRNNAVISLSESVIDSIDDSTPDHSSYL